jgi:MFS transporter, DHA2 family, multidrug resistance protein
VVSGCVFVVRSLRVGEPIVDLTRFVDRRFTVACVLSFLTGVGLYGSVFLMPVFLSFVRGHGPLRIGEIMLVTGVAQLLVAPLVVAAERRVSAVVLASAGFAAFAVGAGMSFFQTWQTDFGEMFWPQVVRGSAVMLCILPPTRIALGHLAPERLPDASGLFNLMRNLGGAIGIALVDTLIWIRVSDHAAALREQLIRGDLGVARMIGVPEAYLSGSPQLLASPIAQTFVAPLVERAALVAAINEAWVMIAAALTVGPVVLFAARLAHAAPPEAHSST